MNLFSNVGCAETDRKSDRWENPKSEIRNPKEIRSPNTEYRNQQACSAFGLRISGFGFLSDFGFRISDFSCACVLLLSCVHLWSADPYAQARQYKHGQPADPLAAIQSEIRSASPEQLRAIEAKLIEIIQAPDAAPDAKSWACRTLRVAGSERSVPALAALLGDKQLSADAQFALRSIRGSKVDEVLRAAIPRTEGLLKAGVIQTLGARGDRQAVALISPLASDSDPVVAEAAIFALGGIGGVEALNGTLAAKVPASLERFRQQAVLKCAESLLDERNTGEAAAAYQALLAQSRDPLVKAGALRGLMRADPSAAAPMLLAAVEDKEPRLRLAAVKMLCETAPVQLQESALGKFASWPPDAQVALLGMATHPAVLPVIRASAANGSEEVRQAALAALGRLGSVSDVPALLAAAASAGPAQVAARQALQSLRGRDVNGALAASVKAGALETRREAVRVLVSRNDTGAVPALLALAAEAESPLRLEALKALGQLAGEQDLPTLVNLLVQGKADREPAENALAALIQRVNDKEGAAAALASALPAASGEARCALLRALTQVPSAKSLAALRAAAKESDAAVQDTAIRGLVDWPDAAAIPDLLGLGRSAANPAHRVLALRGLTRLAVLPGQHAPEAAVKLLAEVLALAPSADEKKAALASLSEISHVSALDLAAKCLSDAAVELEAANTVVRLARKLQAADTDAASAAVQRILDVCKLPAARQMAESAGIVLGDMVNIAPQGVASSPDGLEKDGDASGDQAAIDGNPATYWDEQDNGKLYRLLVTFKQPENIAALSITGYKQQGYAPKDFEVLCDGRPVKKIENVQYIENLFVAPLPETSCQTVELNITGYFGASPAIRELGLYKRMSKTPADYRVLVFTKTLGFRHSNIPLGAATLRRLGPEHRFAVDATEDSAAFTRTNLARYKAVVFLSVTGDVLNPDQESAFKEYLLGGGGFVAIHGALYGPSACEEQWAWYGEVCCAAFKNHSAIVPGRVDVEDREHPSTAGLPEHWSRTDEWYNYAANPRGCAHVLATVDESTYQGGTLGKDHPISWCKRMGKGLVWYTAMGHTEESFGEPHFLKHIIGGIEFVAGVKPGKATPGDKPVQ